MNVNTLLAAAATLLFVFPERSVTAAPPGSLSSINGHGIWMLDTGDVNPYHQPHIESTTINAWLNEDGSTAGTIVWMDILNSFVDGHGDPSALYEAQANVDTYLVLSDHEVYVEGFVFHSSLGGIETGQRLGFYVYDGGPAQADLIFPYEIDPDSPALVVKGGFMID